MRAVLTLQAPRIDPESLEQENDRSIDALGERTNLLRQVANAEYARPAMHSQAA